MVAKKNIAIIIMGVSGVGKTTIGKLLSQTTKIPFFDADDFHSANNIAKMKNGIALTDEDRHEWLLQLNLLLNNQLQNNSCILACSALKESYRNILNTNCKSNIKFVHLTGSYNKVLQQMTERKQHFLPTSLLQSQFETLEMPYSSINISIEKKPNEIVTEIVNELFHQSEIGIIGLGVMGKNLCRNFVNHGFSLAMYNRHVPNEEENIAENFKKEFPELITTQAFDNIALFVAALQKPRKIIIMVHAGKAIDDVLKQLSPYLSAGDVVIDGGNSYFLDTEKRQALLSEKNVFFIGCGISGGEEGALNGPSLMPSGNSNAYTIVQPFLEAIAAKDIWHKPCCAYIGEHGSGHFIKMIHNGIEYVEMQLLAEVYHILLSQQYNPDEIAAILTSWKETSLNSYLLDITISILQEKENNDWLINKIADVAQSKGTGNWATIEITQQTIPATLIATALFARYISAYKNLRTTLHKAYSSTSKNNFSIDILQLQQAYELARIINHFQGFWLIEESFKKFGWQSNLSEIARIWTNGCIIRSALMQELVNVFTTTDNLLLSNYFIEKIKALKPSLTKTVSICIENNIPIACFSEAINFLNAITTSNLSANLLQAQRDYFGAHTFQRNDTDDETFFHHQWKKN